MSRDHNSPAHVAFVGCVLAMTGCLLVAAHGDNSRQTSGSIQGITVYTDGQALPGTTVTLSRGRSRVASTHTGRQGTYQLPNIAAGNYTIEFSLPGFIAVRCPVQVKANTVVTAGAAVAINGLDMGEPSPGDERRRLCFGDGEVPVFMEFATGSGRTSTLILVADIGRAPYAAGHFLKQVGAKAFDRGRIQRGSSARSLIEVTSRETIATEAPAMPFESTRVSGLTHRAGTLSWPQPSSTQSTPPGFMLLLNDDTSLDAGNARYPNREGASAFGRLAMSLAYLKKWDSTPFTIVVVKPAGWIEVRK
jgi:hypothetical protein